MEREGSQPNDHGVGGWKTLPLPTGTLYVVGVPIGHPDDITLRALTTLRNVMVIASEDPRATQALLTHHGILAVVTSYGPPNRDEKIRLFLDRLMKGQDIALVSDNGTPVVYDPGSLLVAAAHEAAIPVKTIPGPSTITAALAISGFSGDAIIFDGCLPSPNRRLVQYVSRLRKERRTFVLYVDPDALAGLMKILAQVLPTRQIAVAMNLTRLNESFCCGPAGELVDQIGPVANDSAVTVLIEGYRAGSHYSSSRRRMITR